MNTQCIDENAEEDTKSVCCPECGSEQTHLFVGSNPHDYGEQAWECLDCDHEWQQ